MGWLAHAAVDGVLALGLLVAGVHGHGADYYILDAAGAYLALAVLLTNAPGGVLKRLPRLAHRVADGLVGLALVLSPLIAWRLGVHLDPFASAIAVAVAVIVLRDAVATDHRVLRPAGGRVIEARAVEAGLEQAARRAGVVAARARRRTVRR